MVLPYVKAHSYVLKLNIFYEILKIVANITYNDLLVAY